MSNDNEAPKFHKPIHVTNFKVWKTIHTKLLYGEFNLSEITPGKKKFYSYLTVALGIASIIIQVK